MAEPTEEREPQAVSGGESAGPDVVDWAEAVRDPSFRDLVSTKVRFIVPLIIFSLAFYLGMTVLAGFAPGFMTQRVIGPINVGYLLILATYLMAWIVALIYVRIANRNFDPKAESVVNTLHVQKKDNA